MNRRCLLGVLALALMLLSCEKTPEPEIAIAQKEYSVGSQGGEVSVNVSSNVSLTATPSADWITLASSAESGGVWRFSVALNGSYDGRSANIIFSGGGLSETVTVTQAQQDAIIPGALEYEYFYEAQTISLPVSSNVEYSVSVSGGDWIKAIGTKGLSGKDILFSLSENSGKEPRESIVSISSGALRQNIRITQLSTTHKPKTEEQIRESVKKAEVIAIATNQILQDARKTIGNNQLDAEAIASEISKIEDIISVKVNPLGTSISYMQRDSLTINLMLNDSSDSLRSLPKSLLSKVSTRSSIDNTVYLNGKKALILAPFVNDFEDPLSQYEALLTQMGYTVRIFEGKDAGIDKFNGDFLSGYDIVIISSHGGHCLIESSQINYSYIITGTPVKTNSSSWNQFLEAWKNIDNPYYGILQDGFIIARNGDLYLAMSNLNLGSARFNNSFIYLSACDQAIDRGSIGSLMSALSNRGAGAVVGYDYSVPAYLGTYLTYGFLVYMGLGSSMATAISRTLEYATDVSDHLFVLPENAEKLFYFFDPSPTHLTSSITGSTIEFSWEQAKTIAGVDIQNDLSYEVYYDVFLDGNSIGTTTAKRMIKQGVPKGDHKWFVLSRSVINGESVDSFRSEEGYFTVEQESNYINLKTGQASSVTGSSAQISTTVETNWNPKIVERGVVYSTSKSTPTVGASDCQTCKSTSTGDSFQVQLTALTPGTKYYARGYVSVNDKDACTVYYGNVVEFTTEKSGGRVGYNVDPVTVDIGKVQVGKYGYAVVNINNTGDVPLTKASCSWETQSGPFSYSFKPTLPLAAGGSIPVTILFEPKSVGPFYATLLVVANNETSDFPGISVSVSGTGVSGSTEPDSGQYNNTMVDLGLSVKWAECNLGAYSSIQSGNLYAWGETIPRNDDMTWSTYKWSRGTENSFTKYCLDKRYGYNGFYDGKEILDPSDDAATEQFGSLYRTPSREEWQELWENCTWKWYSNYLQSGVPGYKITSKMPGYTSKYIFLPATEPHVSGRDSYNSTYGQYMVNSLCLAANNNPSMWFNGVTFDNSTIVGTNGNTITLLQRGNVLARIRPVYGEQSSGGSTNPDAKPKIKVSSTDVKFGEVKVNTTAGEYLTITNTGDATLTLSTVQLVNGNKGFKIPSVQFAGMTIAPNDSYKFQIRFTPSSVGEVTDQLMIKSDAYNTGYILVNLTGSGKK